MPKWFLKLHWFRNSGANTQSWPSCDHRVQASLGCPGAFPGLPHRESHCKHSQPGEAGVGGKYCSTGQLGGRHHHQGHSAPLSLSLSVCVCVCVRARVCLLGACRGGAIVAGGLETGLWPRWAISPAMAAITLLLLLLPAWLRLPCMARRMVNSHLDKMEAPEY